MSDLLELIKNRRSIRKYLNKIIEDEKIEKIIEAGRLAPSATNKQPWRFAVVTDKKLISQISSKGLGVINRWSGTAPLLIIGCIYKKKSIVSKLADKIIGINLGLIDISIALEHMVLEAQDLGLSSCWIGWFNNEKIKNILELPQDWTVVSVIPIGYADPSFLPAKRELLSYEKIIIKK